MAPWPSPLTQGPVLDRPPSGSSGASKPYSQRGCMPFLGLAPSVPSDCRGRGPALFSSTSVSLSSSGATFLGPRDAPLFPPSTPLSSLDRVVWGVSVPSPPPSVLPHHSVALSGHSRGFVPPWQCFHSGGANSLRQLDSSSHSLVVPPGVFRHSIGLAASSIALHSGGLARNSVGLAPPPSASHSRGLDGRFFSPARNPLPCPGSRPMAAFRSCLVGGCGGGIGGVTPASRCAP